MLKTKTKPEAALFAALFAASQSVEKLTATERVVGPEEWSFAPLAEVRRVAKAALAAQGLMLVLTSSSVAPASSDRDLRVEAVFSLVHPASGGVLDVPMCWPVARVADHKDQPQAVTSSISHAWRTVIMQLLCIEVVPATALPRALSDSGPAPVWEAEAVERTPLKMVAYTPTGLADLVTWWTEWETSVRSPLGNSARPTWADAWGECSGGPARPPVGEHEKAALFYWLSEKHSREAA